MHKHQPVADGELEFEPITTGKFNTCFFVRNGDEDLVLRLAPSRDEVSFYERYMMRQEPRIYALL